MLTRHSGAANRLSPSAIADAALVWPPPVSEVMIRNFLVGSLVIGSSLRILKPGRLAQILRWGSSQFWLLPGDPSVDVDLRCQYPIMLYRSRFERRLRLRRV